MGQSAHGRYRDEGEAAFEPRSRRPLRSPAATAAEVVELVLQLRGELSEAGLDAGAQTIAWHLRHHHQVSVAPATIHRILIRAGLVRREPRKRPKSSYTRFVAEQPNETWQSDFTHYRLTRPDGTTGADVQIITWLDDHSRYALHVSAHRSITIVTWIERTYHRRRRQRRLGRLTPIEYETIMTTPASQAA